MTYEADDYDYKLLSNGSESPCEFDDRKTNAVALGDCCQGSKQPWQLVALVCWIIDRGRGTSPERTDRAKRGRTPTKEGSR